MAPAASPAQAMAAPAKGGSSQRPDDEDTKPYVITQEIGKGSFATVYKGYHKDTHHAVAIKAVSRSILTQKLLENLKSEIDILKQLSHKHITQLTDIVRSPSHIHLVMEFCAGGDLSQYIKSRGRVDGLQYSPRPGAPVQFYPHPRGGGLEQRCVRCFLRQLARALKFLRSRNLIHRDIKPQNLLLTPAAPTDHNRGHPIGIPVLKVADFGFARILPNTMMAETLCGSPLYMAPEILRYEKYDAKADLWSVGAVLYEMSVGKPPFRAQNHIELLRKIEASKGVKFPEEDESHPAHPLSPLNPKSPNYNPGMGNTRMEEKMAQVVPDDLKALMRRLLVRKSTERASFEEFFSSQALRNSKFSVPSTSESSVMGEAEQQSISRSGHKLPTEGVPMAHRAAPAAPVQTLVTAEETLAYGPGMSPRARARAATNKERIEAKKAENIPKVEKPDKERSAAQNSANARSPKRHPEPLPPSPKEAKQALPQPESQGDARPRRIAEPVFDPPPPASVEVKGIPPRFRRPTPGADGQRDGVGHEDSAPRNLSSAPLSHPPTLSESDSIPGEAAEDGQLRRDYVLIDRKVVEFDRAVDEIQTNTNRRRPLHDRRAATTPLPEDSLPVGDLTHTPQLTPITFPPRPASAIVPGQNHNNNYSPPIAGALARALSIASKRLFGSRTSSPGYSPPAKKGIIRDMEKVSIDDQEDDPAEETLLISLEELAQKTQVLANWAGEMYESVKAIPQKPLPDPNRFVQKEGEAERAAQRRKKAEVEDEFQAVTCVAVYMLLMSFSQKGIHALGRHKADLEMRFPDKNIEVSEGFDLALEWFKKNFIKCNDRATRVKAWLPVEFEAQNSTWLDQILYDRALELGRNAAGKEATNYLDEAERLYEESLWCLRALRDDILKPDGPFMAEDTAEVDSWIKRTDKRLRRCRAKKGE